MGESAREKGTGFRCGRVEGKGREAETLTAGGGLGISERCCVVGEQRGG